MMDMCCGDEVKGEGYILNLITSVPLKRDGY